jgi:UPF0716 protein FxsA
MGFLAFIVLLPLVEIILFIAVAMQLGLAGTLVELALTAFVGLTILRHGGFKTIRKVQAAVMRGEQTQPVALDGAVLLFAGLLLVIPGFLTDLVGALLLIPVARRLFVRLVGVFALNGHFRVTPAAARSAVIDGDYRIVEPAMGGRAVEHL